MARTSSFIIDITFNKSNLTTWLVTPSFPGKRSGKVTTEHFNRFLSIFWQGNG
jgi:hypothetical protein